MALEEDPWFAPPPIWAERVLATGRGLVLVDGLEEISSESRQHVRERLLGPAAAFLGNRWLVTSRSSAVRPDWLSHEGRRFREHRRTRGARDGARNRSHRRVRLRHLCDFGPRRRPRRLTDRHAARRAGQCLVEGDRVWPVPLDQVAVDAHTGDITAHNKWSNYPPPAKLSKLGVAAHMGILFGIGNQIALAVIAIGLILGLVRGYRMRWQRRPTRTDRRAAFGRAVGRGVSSCCRFSSWGFWRPWL